MRFNLVHCWGLGLCGCIAALPYSLTDFSV